MERYVRDFRYGNADASGPIDQFWLGSSLQISAFEQVDFLKQLVAQQLPVSERSVRIVREILINEATMAYVLRAKTGVVSGTPGVGWWVGWSSGTRIRGSSRRISIRTNPHRSGSR